MNWKHYLENKLPICNSRNVQKGKSSMLDTCRKPLLEVCDLLDSKRVPVTSNKRIHGPYPYYGANGIQDYVNDYIFDDDLVLLAEDGGNFGSKDKPIAYRVSGKCWVNNHAHVLKPREGLNVDYLCYSLMYYDTKGLVNGATRQKLTQAAMKNIKIPILAYNEQLKIVKRIAMVSTLINNRKKELSLLDKLVKSRFIEMFGIDKVENCRWPVEPMRNLFSITSSQRILKSEWKTEGNIPFLRVRDMVQLANREPLENEFYVTEDFYNSRSDQEKVKEGDIIVSATSTIGKTYIIRQGEQFYFKDADVLLFRKKKPINEFFFAYGFTMPTVWNQVSKGLNGTTVPHLLISNAQKLKQPVPPIALQNQFEALLRQVDKSKMAVQRSLDELETLKKSLMQTYFG